MPSRPLSLLAELTYRCNLGCPYCYNPVELRAGAFELDSHQWCGVIDSAAGLGVLQVHLSGGEPTLRPDVCCAVIQRARAHDLYTNLITQGTFLDERLLDRLEAVGLDHIQISVQAAHAPLADLIAAARVHERKVAALERVRRRRFAVTLNCVLHSRNIDSVADIIALAEQAGVRRLELANAQFYGWAFVNRAALLPTREQVERAKAVARDAGARLAGRMEIKHVLADYYEEFPKPCMGGWGSQFLTIMPDGRVLPCPAASCISNLHFDTICERSLAAIWSDSPAFEAFRGTAWMPEPCRSCERREVDWGGCRCQAFLLTGDAGATDPACTKSPHHASVGALLPNAGAELVARRL